MLSFRAFISEATYLAPAELYKYPNRLQTFLDKYKKGGAFLTNDNTKVVLKYDEMIFKKLKDKINPASIIFFSADGHSSYKLSDLVKTQEFGGKTSDTGEVKSSTTYEDAVIAIINERIAENGGVIDIKLKGRSEVFKGITMALKVTPKIKGLWGISADPKTDIILCVEPKYPLEDGSIYISHKKTGGPEAFQQYSGVTVDSSTFIAHHPLTNKFTSELVKIIGTAPRLEHPVMGTFNNDEVSNHSIFGSDYATGEFNLNSVHAIGQGDPILEKTGSTFTLSFSHHMALSGDLSHFVGGYKPVYGATYRLGRSFKHGNTVIKNVRLGVYPQRLVANRNDLITVKL